MSLWQKIQQRLSSFGTTSSNPTLRSRRVSSRRPMRLEALEQRRLLAVFNVNSDLDTVDASSSDEGDIVAVGSGATGQISGTTFNDADGDGVFDAEETGLPDWTIYLDMNGNGEYDEDGYAVTYDSPDVPVDIDGSAVHTSTLTIPEGSGTLADVNVVLNIAHGYDWDLVVDLMAPDGTTVNLFTNVGGSGENFTGTTLDDEASTSISSGSAPFTGSYQPAGNLSDFDGLDAAGTWTLQITDTYPGSDDGTLNSWSLELDVTGVSEPSAVTDANGDYTFTNLAAGTYIVAEIQQSGWTQTYPATSSSSSTSSSTSADDVSEDLLTYEIISSASTPPTTLEYQQTFADADSMEAADVLLTEVPTSTWTYGCTATSAGMIFGYYDRTGYSDMYTGPTNGGVAPLTNLGQGDDPDNPVAGATSLIATMDGFDGRSGAGHVDDYWISYDSTGPDPWESGGTEHTWGECTADYLGTNQWKWDTDGNTIVDSNSDGATTVWSYSTGDRLYDYVPPASLGTPQTAACHGLRLFAESRGYTVLENYTQKVDTVASGGFSFSDFMTEIDNGCPVMLHVVGHTMVGVGYEAASSTVYLHDTWDNSVHTMPWGGYYSGMLMQSVTIIHLEEISTVPDGVHIVELDPGEVVTDIDFGNHRDVTNEPPTVALTNTVTSLPEDTDTTTRTKMADIVVTDDGVGTNVLSLTGDDAALFEIDGDELFLIAGVTLDYETNPVLDVTVEVDDVTLGSGEEDSASLAVTLSDVNEAPTVELTNATTTLPEDTDTTSRLKVADIVVTDDALGTNDLSLTGDDAALFEIDGAELYLIAGATLNYETNPVLDVTVEVDDATLGTGIEDSASLAIALTDENEAPTIELTGTTTTLPENTDTTARLKVADIVVTDDGFGTNVLSLTGTDAGFFEIDGTELYLIAGAGLDFETNPVLDVTVEVDDATIGTGAEDSDALAITVTDINEAPTVDLTNTTTSLSEDTDTTSRLKVADITVTDDALGTNVLALTGDDGALFEIDGTELYLIAGATLDYATNPVLDVTVELDDTTIGTGADDTASLSITVIQVNDPPTVTLINTTTTLPEDTNLTTRLKVADMEVTDDGVGANVLSLTGTDAALFQIVGTGLYLVAGTTLDFETNPVLDVTVEVDDATLGTGVEDSDALAIAITDVNEAPTVELTNTTISLPEDTDTTSRLKMADIVILDDALGTNVLSLTGADVAMFEIDGTELYLIAGATLEYLTNPVLDVTVKVDDTSLGSGAEDTTSLSIALIQHNDPPTVSLTNTTTTLPEDTDLTTRLKVADIEVADDGVGANALTLTGTDAALFEIDGTELFLTAGAALDYETNPDLDVAVEVDDAELGTGAEDSAALAITVTDANDAPVVTLTNTTTSFAEDTDTTARLKVADIVVTDDALGTYVLALAGDDVALFEIDGTELFLIAGATLDHDANPVLDVTVEVDDETLGTGADNSASLAITVTAVNHPPTVSLANTTTTLPEDTDTTSRLKVADIVVTDDDLGTNDLSLAGADAELFEIDGLELFLAAGARLNYETTPLLDVTVEVDDSTLGSTPDDTAAMQISLTDVDEFDYGDAPDAATGTATGDYHTLASDSGPSHLIVSTLYLGGSVDEDDGTLQNAAANADDVDQASPDDEDGVRDPAADLALTVGTQPTVNLTVTNTTGSAATLTGWIDYNNDGVFDNATERAQATVATGTTAGIVTLTFPTVPSGFTGVTYARFRLSTDAAAADPTGYATDGEVEDYAATIVVHGDGTVEAHQKISATEGNFTGTLAEDGLFGWSVADLGDLDGDGVTDMAVGARHDDGGGVRRGAVWIVFLNADGTVKSQQKISDTEGNFTGTLDDGDEFGWSVAGMGDLDGDGVADLAVGAYGDDDGASAAGAVWMLFLNPDGTVKAHQKISNTEGNFTDTLDTTDLFGTAVANVGDFNGDGVTDLAVGGYGDDDGDGPSHGAVWMLFLNSDGTVKAHQKISDTEGNFTGTLDNYDLFGSAVTSIGDLDGDGVTDLAVGAHQDDDGGIVRGAVWVLLLNEDGTVKSHQKLSDTEGTFLGTLKNYDHFGHDVANVGDFDGDGVTDIAVGAYTDDGGGTSRGAVWMLFLNSDGTVKDYQEINDISGNFLGTLEDSDFFGTSVTTLGDLDGDGTVDLAVGTSADNDGGTTEGAVYVLFMETLNTPPTVSLANTTTTLSEGTDTTARIKLGDIVVTDDGAGTNVLSLTGADAALFEIDGTELYLVAGTTLDHQANPVLDVTVEVDDTALGTTAEDSVALAVSITEVNEAPTVELTGTTITLPEDTDTTARLKVANIVVTDDGLGTNVLSLTGADAALFEIVGTELYLVAGTTLDFETNPVLDVTVEVDDATLGAGADDSTALTIAVTDVGEFEFGDAPEAYRTLLASDGARHVATGPMLGTSRDVEFDGQPSTLADGDDKSGTADEDGIVGYSPFAPGMTGASVDLVVSAASYVNAWIDFNGDGTWDSSEQVATDLALTAGTNHVTFAIPVTAVPGATYARLRLTSYDTGGTLLPTGLANDGEVEDHLVQIDDELYLYGTEDDDTVVVTTDGSDYTVTINGVADVYSAAIFSSIVLDANGGSDSLEIYDWTGNDTFAVDPSQATMDWGSDGVDFTGFGFERVTGVAANGGADEATLTGTTGADKFYGKETQAYVYDAAGTDYRYTASGFDTTTGVSGGGDDLAYLYGSTGDDALDVTVGAATMTRSGSTTSVATGFAYLNSYGVAGGTDTATMTSTTGTDVFTGKETYAYMRNDGGADYLLYVTSFNEVTAYGDADDTAYLYGGASDDTLEMGVSSSTLTRSGSTTTVAGDFGTVNGYAGAGGTDTATMTGSTGTDLFSGKDTDAYMRNVGGSNDYFLYAASFNRVTAYAGGGVDLAYLYGSASDDTLDLSPSSATMTRSGSTTTVANDFATAYGYAGLGGTDTATLTGSTGADVFYGRESLAYMRNVGGSDYFLYTRDFNEVTANAGGGDDAAYLWGSTSDDTLDMSVGSATMTRSGSSTTAVGDFATVYGYATSGGTDTASLTGSTGDDVFYSREIYSILRDAASSAYQFYVGAFGAVEADGNGGAGDVAYLYGSANNDALDLTVGSSTMTRAGSSTAVATDFANVNGYAVAGGTDTATLTGSTGSDKFTGKETYAYMKNDGGTDYTLYADKFSEVTAYAGGGDDMAYLYGSVGSDTLAMSMGSSTMTRAGSTSTVANNFATVKGYAVTGGTDTATLTGTTGADTFTGQDDWGILKDSAGTSYFNYIRYFDEVYADAGDTTSGNDTLDVSETAGVWDVDYLFDPGDLLDW